jgi:condensin complex subunit 3
MEKAGNNKKKLQGQDAEGDTVMNEAEEEEDEEIRDTSEKRAVLRLLNSLTKYMSSKEKAVRYRTSQLLTLLLSNSLLTFPFDYSAVSLKIFRIVRHGLEKRVLDKEAIVRVQAAIGLCRLLEMGVPSGDDEGNSDEEEEPGEGIVEILIDSLQNDSSAYVYHFSHVWEHV